MLGDDDGLVDWVHRGAFGAECMCARELVLVPQGCVNSGVKPNEPGALVIPAPTAAEVDYLLGQRLGSRARRAFLRDLAAGRLLVAGLDREDYATVIELESRYGDLELGLA